MKKVKIGTTDVLLENYETGKGKIIISDLLNGSYSFYWGAMGDTLENFIKRIDSCYFANKLCNNNEVFSAKKTATAVRRYIRKELSYELPWYKFLSAQKELREEIKKIETTESGEQAVSVISNLHKNVNCLELNYQERKEFLDIIKSVFSCEPWHFLATEPSKEYNYLVNLHKKLKKVL